MRISYVNSNFLSKSVSSKYYFIDKTMMIMTKKSKISINVRAVHAVPLLLLMSLSAEFLQSISQQSHNNTIIAGTGSAHKLHSILPIFTTNFLVTLHDVPARYRKCPQVTFHSA